MSIMRAKYKAHKFVNIVFYLLVFVLGFFAGIGINKLNISNLISNFLMIDNVNAYTLYSSNQLTVTEETIYNDILIANPNFDFDTYHNFVCATSTKSLSGKTFYSPSGSSYSNFSGFNGYKLDCYILTDTQKDAITSISYNSSSKTHTFSPSISGNFYEFFLILGTNSATGRGYFTLFNTNSSSISVYDGNGSLGNKLHTNFDFDFTYSRYSNDLDFSDYLALEMVFDEDLFANDSNFKEVCVNANKPFAITKTERSEDNYETTYDFIWFKNYVRGLYMQEYTSSFDFDTDNILQYNDDVSSFHYEFSSQEAIDNDVFPYEADYNYFLHKGYFDSPRNKYTYYGYSAYRFTYQYSYVDDNFLEFFPIFHFDNPVVYTNDTYGISRSFDDFEDENGNVNVYTDYCFYIKNEYNVQYLNKDQFGDYYGTIDTPNGTYTVRTSYNAQHVSFKESFSSINNLISRLSSTINFINEEIYNFYTEMPYLVKLFVVAIFGLILIKIIIGMVVK